MPTLTTWQHKKDSDIVEEENISLARENVTIALESFEAWCGNLYRTSYSTAKSGGSL